MNYEYFVWENWKKNSSDMSELKDRFYQYKTTYIELILCIDKSLLMMLNQIRLSLNPNVSIHSLLNLWLNVKKLSLRRIKTRICFTRHHWIEHMDTTSWMKKTLPNRRFWIKPKNWSTNTPSVSINTISFRWCISS